MSVPMPEVQANAGVYLYQWPEATVMVERLSEYYQNITGELTIYCKVPGYEGLIEKTRINLLSEQTRKRLAMTCSERTNELDWVSIIKYAAILTVEDYRKGEPVVEIGNKPSTMVLDYQLDPILEQGQATTLYGAGGAGKSYLADFIAVLVQYGYTGMGLWVPKQGNVLILDWETSQTLHERRVWAIKHGLCLDTEVDTISYRFCTQPLVADIVEIQRIVLEKNIDLVVVDSQVAATGGDIEKSEAANSFYNALRSLRCTTLTIDHVPKNSEGGRAMPFGSVFKWNRARSVFELRSVQESDSNVLELGLYHRKHNEGKLLKPLGIRVEFTESSGNLDKVAFSPADIRKIPDLSTGLSKRERIAEELRAGTSTVAELAEVLDDSKENIRATLNRYKDVFTKIDQNTNTWGLLHEE